MRVILLRGLAASGKSTLMKKICRDNIGYISWSKDDYFDDLLNQGVKWNEANQKVYDSLFKKIKIHRDSDIVFFDRCTLL